MFQGPSQCRFCLKEVESQEHILLHCVKAKQIWLWSALMLDGSVVTRNSHIHNHLKEWWKYGRKKTLKGLLSKVMPAYTLWSIWKQYNKRIYEESPYRFEGVTNGIRKLLQTWIWANLSPADRSSRQADLEELGFTVNFELSI